MKTSKTGIDLIKEFESCSLKAYKCPAGVLTIGYGHTGLVNGKPITSDMTITELLAETLLAIDLQKFENAVNKLNLELNQNQFDSIISFIFNIGSGNFQSSTMLKKLKAKDYVGASNEFDKWIYAKGKKLAGLIKRRAKEKLLFLKK